MPFRNFILNSLKLIPLLGLLSSSALAQGFSSPTGSSFYGEQLRPKVSNQMSNEVLETVGWSQNLDQQIPLNLTFRDEDGQQVKLKKYFGEKPVLVEMVYFYCPMLCGEVLKGTFRGLKDLAFRPGRDYEMIVVSINPKEGPELAKAKKAAYLKDAGMEAEADGIHFLTGTQENIMGLSQAIGFQFSYDKKTDQFAHPAGFVLATPNGRIARYMTGVIFEPKDLRLGFLEAGQGKIGSPLDLIVLKCFHYDGQTGKYTFAIMEVLRVAGLATIILVGLLMVVLVRRDIAKTKSREEEL